MNTLGSLRYAVTCKKYTCFGVLFLFLILLSLSILCGSSKLSACLCLSTAFPLQVSVIFRLPSVQHLSYLVPIMIPVLLLGVCPLMSCSESSLGSFLHPFVFFSLSTCPCDCIVICHLIIQVFVFCFDFFFAYFFFPGFSFHKISFICYTYSVIQLLYRCLYVFNNGTGRPGDTKFC